MLRDTNRPRSGAYNIRRLLGGETHEYPEDEDVARFLTEAIEDSSDSVTLVPRQRLLLGEPVAGCLVGEIVGGIAAIPTEDTVRILDLMRGYTVCKRDEWLALIRVTR